MASVWNPMRSYDDNINWQFDPFEETKNSPFWVKLLAAFLMFSRYLSNPGYKKNAKYNFGLEEDRSEEDSQVIHHKSTNHLGIYDYCTLGIPYLIESFFRGHFFFSKRKHQDYCKYFFCIFPPIVPILFLIRHLIAAVAMIPASFIGVLIIEGIELIQELCLKLEKREKEIYEREGEFHSIYNKFKIILNPEKYSTRYSNQAGDSSEFSSLESATKNAIELWRAAKKKGTYLDESVHTSRYARRFGNLLGGIGKYGTQENVVEILQKRFKK